MSGRATRLRSAAGATRRDPRLALLAVRCYLFLIVMRGAIRALELRRIGRFLGEHLRETPRDEGVDEAQLRYARRVALCIRKVAPHTPTNSNCYPQALTAHWLLHRRGIPSTFYYGAAIRPGDGGLETHVWVRCARFIVTGAPVHRAFAVVSTYADVPKGATVQTVPASLSTPHRPA